MNYYIRLRGGLGNQMFQYAYTYLLRKMNGDGDIFLDTRYFNDYYRSLDLTDMRLALKTYVCEKKHLKYDIPFKLFDVYRYIHKKITKKRISKLNPFLLRLGFVFGDVASPLPKKLVSKDAFLFGYFQDADVIMPYINEFYDIFTFNIKKDSRAYTILKSIKSGNIAISVRISENDKTEKLKYTDKQYYFDCLDYFKRTKEIKQIFVMSNLINTIKSERWFDDYAEEVVYLEDCTPCEQMEIMKHCENFIISNSTFSWWGAVLGTSISDGIILAPEIWYGGDRLVDTKMMTKRITII